jgi:hypothetical protein
LLWRGLPSCSVLKRPECLDLSNSATSPASAGAGADISLSQSTRSQLANARFLDFVHILHRANLRFSKKFPLASFFFRYVIIASSTSRHFFLGLNLHHFSSLRALDSGCCYSVVEANSNPFTESFRPPTQSVSLTLLDLLTLQASLEARLSSISPKILTGLTRAEYHG